MVPTAPNGLNDYAPDSRRRHIGRPLGRERRGSEQRATSGGRAQSGPMSDVQRITKRRTTGDEAVSNESRAVGGSHGNN